MRLLAALFGLSRVSLAKLGLALALFVLALALTIAALAQLIDALGLALLMLTAEPVLASLITGLILLGLAFVLLLAGRAFMRREARAAHAAAAGARVDLLAQAMALVQKNSRQAALTAAVVGFLVGFLPDLMRPSGVRPESSKDKSPEEPGQQA